MSVWSAMRVLVLVSVWSAMRVLVLVSVWSAMRVLVLVWSAMRVLVLVSVWMQRDYSYVHLRTLLPVWSVPFPRPPSGLPCAYSHTFLAALER